MKNNIQIQKIVPSFFHKDYYRRNRGIVELMVKTFHRINEWKERFSGFSIVAASSSMSVEKITLALTDLTIRILSLGYSLEKSSYEYQMEIDSISLDKNIPFHLRLRVNIENITLITPTSSTEVVKRFDYIKDLVPLYSNILIFRIRDRDEKIPQCKEFFSHLFLFFR